ncbi:hypothetical protein F5878DRAFT_602097 [Lentinula raphanica]|uniref:Uncharacterized protein n=1 Tax=Lentinula raphanica TaxID=153919 RepID=A0AA38UK72_9AGAR|nr:hypothetical protein F5878DRAFT_602097 [Lentinula raphanica]
MTKSQITTQMEQNEWLRLFPCEDFFLSSKSFCILSLISFFSVLNPTSLMAWSLKKTDSRTFINLIYLKSSKFANWEPAFPIELGDFGTVDRETGEFRKDGNVFKHEKTPDPKKLFVRTGGEDDKYTIVSSDVIEIKGDIGPDVEIPGLIEAELKACFKFGRDHGAVLLMSRPVTSKLEGLDSLLSKGCYDHLLHKYLVTEIVTCSAYAMYLSGKKAETVALSFHVSLPVPAALGVNAGGGMGTGWFSEGVSGVFKCGPPRSVKAGQNFTTLYHAVKIGRRGIGRRELQAPDPKTLGEDCWMNSVPPWNSLDGNGEEEESDNEVETDDW